MDASAPRTRKRPHLTTFRDVRREMGRVYRDVRAGRLLSQDGTRLIYMLQAIARTLELELGSDYRLPSALGNVAYPATNTSKLLDKLISQANSDSATASRA